jgi:hypothetical protein
MVTLYGYLCWWLSRCCAIRDQAYNEFDLRRTRQIEVQGHALSLAELAAAEQRQTVQGFIRP